jgi:hypothetical protein
MSNKSRPMIGVHLLFLPLEIRDGDPPYTCLYEEQFQETRALVRFTPPIPGWKYNLEQDITSALLAPRYRRGSLASMSGDWPVTVNLLVAIPNPSGIGESWSLLAGIPDPPGESWSLCDIGELSIADQGSDAARA